MEMGICHSLWRERSIEIVYSTVVLVRDDTLSRREGIGTSPFILSSPIRREEDSQEGGRFI